MQNNHKYFHKALKTLSRIIIKTQEPKMNSKHGKVNHVLDTPRPQKPYKGQGEAHRRRVLRDHLFSHRLISLANLYKGKPLPVFESSHRLIRMEVDFFGRKFELLMSLDDPWTRPWMDTLRRFTRSMDYQFSLVGSAVGAIFGAFGMTAYMTSVFNTFLKTLTASALSTLLAIGILLKADNPFIQCQAMTLIITNLGVSFTTLANIAWPLAPTNMIFQSNTTEKPFTWVPSAVALLLTILMGGATAGQMVGIFSRTSALGYTMSTIVGLHRILSESLKDLVPYVYKTITGKDWHVEELATNMTKFTDFVTSVEEFERDKLGSLDSDWAVQLEAFSLQTKYKELLIEAQRLGLSRTLTPIVSGYWNKINSWIKRVSASGILLAGHRAEPASILISGKPGMGKSYLVNELVRDVGGDDIPWGTIPGETIANHIYVRNPQEAYWSGYRGHFCTLYDDLGQMADTESAPDPEFLEIIQAVGDNAFKIPMADIEDKNRGYFRSPLVIATTNLDRLSSTTVKSIRHPTALARRFDIHVEMVKKGKERMYYMMQDGSPAELVTYEELINLLRAKYRMKQDKFAQRSQQAQVRESNVQHVCVAHRLVYLSGPSSIVGTELKRRTHNANNPDHSYCHPSLHCRQRQQGIWDFFFGSTTATADRTIYFCQLLWDPRIKTYLNLDEQTQQDILDWEIDTQEALQEAGLDGEINSTNWIENGLRQNTIAWNYLVENRKDLLAKAIRVKICTTQSNIVDGLTSSVLEDIASDGILPVTYLIESWGAFLFAKIKKTFSYLGGVFTSVITYMSDLTFNHPQLLLSFLAFAPLFINTATKCFAQMLGPTTTPTPNDDFLANELARRFQEKKQQAGTLNSHESRDMKGAQKSNKARSLHMTRESRDMIGAQKSNRTATLKMRFESNDRVEFLQEYHHGTFSYVGVREDLLNFACKMGGENVADLLRFAFIQYTDLLIEATAGGGYTRTQMIDRMKDLYRQAAKVTSEELVLEALDATQKEKRLVLESENSNSFDNWIKMQDVSFEYQGSADQNADGVSKAMTGNIFDIKCAGSLSKASQIFFYTSRTAWCNKHTYDRIKDHDFTISRYKKDNSTEDFEFKWRDCQVVRHPELDVVIIRFPKTLTPLPSMKKHLFNDKDLDFKMLPACRLVTRRDGEVVYMQTSSPFLIEKASMEAGDLVPACSSIGYTNMNTIVGDCGAPLLALDPTRQRKICGMHFLGNSFGSGQAVIITLDLLESMESCGEMTEELEYQYKFSGCEVDTAVEIPLGMTRTPFEPTKTKVRRSAIHGEVSEPITRPSILRVTAECDPMTRGIKELHGPRIIVPQSFVDEAQQVLIRYTSGEVMDASTLTIEKALTAEGIRGLEPIELSTSAGLPLCLETDARGKRKWITDERQPTPEFRKMMTDFIDEIKNGQLEDIPIFKETLKDERVKLAKADYDHPDKIKTRLFSASPLKLLVALRMYYGTFMAHAVRNEIRNTCTSGANPHGPDWQMIADWLHEVSDKVDDGDYSCFDTSQPSGFLKAVYDSIRAWYRRNGGSKEDDLIRERLAELCYHPFRSARGVVYRTNGSLPSGMFGTTQINSGSNLVAFYYAFRYLYPESTSEDFLASVRTVTHGDDVLFSVSDAFKGFTSENIGRALTTVGMTFTPADKGGTATLARPIEQTTFLKRGFKKICGIYRAPLATSSSLEMCNWITKSADPLQATIDNCKAAFRELAVSEEDTTLQEQIRDAIYRKTNGRHLLPIVTQKEAINSFLKHF
ncbi:polymerase polyprotein [Kuiper virus]|uniref:Polyprotein n=1 Tax=Drellivirus 93C3 TaxID=1925775 RepID=A0A1L4A1T5_9VIRU|nr:polymerase polyprotein [Lacticaseibacillus casei UW1]API61898.1 polyprotein [Drellivirus 93C3]